MGVDANLYLGNHIQPEVIAYTLAKAAGVDPDEGKDKPNVYSASQYIKTHDFSPATYWNIVVNESGPRYHFHRSDDLNPFGPTWLLSGPSRDEILSVLRVVAERLGGFLVWRDSDDLGEFYQGPEDKGFASYWNIAYNTPKAEITDKDKEHAA